MWDMYTNKFLYIPVIDKDLLKAFKHFCPYFFISCILWCSRVTYVSKRGCKRV